MNDLYRIWATIAHDIQIQCCVKATQTSADYILANAPFAKYFIGSKLTEFGIDEEGRNKLIKFSLDSAVGDGLIMEFGVFTGSSINFIAENIQGVCHGFDSFEGLPEDWKAYSLKGEFNRAGQPPDVRENVKLHIGWFDDSLPKFLENHSEHVSFVHIDCDLYSSTITVLRTLLSRLVAGSVIVFDEYFNYPGWEDHEHRAWHEFVSETGIKYEYIGYAARHYSLAVRITSNPTRESVESVLSKLDGIDN